MIGFGVVDHQVVVAFHIHFGRAAVTGEINDNQVVRLNYAGQPGVADEIYDVFKGGFFVDEQTGVFLFEVTGAGQIATKISGIFG